MSKTITVIVPAHPESLLHKQMGAFVKPGVQQVICAEMGPGYDSAMRVLGAPDDARPYALPVKRTFLSESAASTLESLPKQIDNVLVAASSPQTLLSLFRDVTVGDTRPGIKEAGKDLQILRWAAPGLVLQIQLDGDWADLRRKAQLVEIKFPEENLPAVRFPPQPPETVQLIRNVLPGRPKPPRLEP